MTYRKKLIEVALPLEAINVASAREKSIRHGHPSTLHLWWARRPLAACRAVLFASLVDDPSAHPEEFPTDAAQDAERERLFRIIEKLVLWENSNNPEVLDAARAEILKSTNGNPPPVLDPFAGGGSIPLEAQRLGLEAHASDLNPVAVLINKALIEIPPKFAGQPPINPEARGKLGHSGTWNGASGLAEDVRYYGKWMRDEAEKRIGHLYPKVKFWRNESTGEIYTEAEYRHIEAQTNTLISDPTSLLPHAGDLEAQEATVIAWIWARTVKCPNPACGCRMPLIRSFALSTKVGKAAWVEPIVDAAAKRISFTVRTGNGTWREATVGKRGAICLCCSTPVPLEHVRAEGKAKRMGAQLMAIVAEGKRGRIYLPPTPEQEAIAASAVPDWTPETELVPNSRHMTPTVYGMTTHAELFTPRQLVALSTFSDLVSEARAKAKADFVNVKGNVPNAKGKVPNAEGDILFDKRNVSFDVENGSNAEQKGGIWDSALLEAESDKYAAGLATFLSFVVDKQADLGNTLNRWEPVAQCPRQLFSRQAIPMVWDYAEGNPLGTSSGSWEVLIENEYRGLNSQPMQIQSPKIGNVIQFDAKLPRKFANPPLVSTDPPYYDNVPYADLSDFFYVWLRRSLSGIYPDLFGTMLVPKAQELVSDPFRHGGKEASRQFFEDGMRCVFTNIYQSANPEYPVTVFYAFKQSESDEDDEDDAHPVAAVASTGWETMLQGLMDSGFQITGTWPMRTELGNRMRGHGSNALASSIVLVCRPRPETASVATRREFVNALRREMETALLQMMHGNIAPVDLAQATLGPGMAVYSRYKQVVETDGKPLRVRAALQIINQELDAILSAGEGDYDGDTRFCIAWFEQYGVNPAAFGDADVMARAKNTSVSGLVESGVLEAKAGKVRLLNREEYDDDWNPATDARLPVWECTQRLVRALLEEGESGASILCRSLSAKAEPARDLAYRLYSICERKGWASEALAYNSLVIAWPEITRMAMNTITPEPELRLDV